MAVISIDPGTTESAWLIYDAGKICGFAIQPNHDVLGMIRNFSQFRDGGKAYINHMAIEMMQSFGMAVGQDVLETVYWIGRFCEAWETKAVTFADDANCMRLFRKQIVMHLCHNARAKDANVRRSLIDRFGGDKSTKGPTKCPACKGKGEMGRPKARCEPCRGTGQGEPAGPLHGIANDCWSALAISVVHEDLLNSF